MSLMEIVVGDDGLARCWWGSEPEIYRVYHDNEWGRPTTDDHRLFEKVCLEGFQAGLSWLTILRKRENFRAAFAGFDPARVAGFDETDVSLLLSDEGIIRHEGKIRSTINNSERALDLIDEHGSLSSYFWSWAGPETPAPTTIAPITETSTALSKDLKKRGWSFVGPTTIYAFMESTGLINDHMEGCHVREACALERRSLMSAT
jgi:DNA-3-methyladenine glycosylase I